MTITEAAQLVIQAGAMGKGGDVLFWIWESQLKFMTYWKWSALRFSIKSKDNQKEISKLK